MVDDGWVGGLLHRRVGVGGGDQSEVVHVAAAVVDLVDDDDDDVRWALRRGHHRWQWMIPLCVGSRRCR